MTKNKLAGKKMVLLVEDDEAIAKAIEKSFDDEKIELLIAHYGVEGLIAAEKEKPALILLDIIMPRMDGITMLRKLRTTSWGKNIPVIILTNLSSPVQESAAGELNVADYLVKTDWKLSDVTNKVKKMLAL